MTSNKKATTNNRKTAKAKQQKKQGKKQITGRGWGWREKETKD